MEKENNDSPHVAEAMRGKMEKIVSLCKRRGFIYPASEIYGGFANAFDYGPLGTQMKKNIKDAWWQKFVVERNDIVGLDSAIIQNPKVWEASGHLKSFSDPLVECKKCHARFRVDQLLSGKDVEDARQIAAKALTDWINREKTRLEKIKKIDEEKESFSNFLKDAGWSLQTREEFLKHLVDLEKIRKDEYDKGKQEVEAIKFLANSLKQKRYIGLIALVALRYRANCKECGEKGDIWTLPKEFNLMFKTYVGATEDMSSVAYLRPETAQGIFTNFQNVVQSSRVKIPFGIAQIGKAFRNEITPGNFIFRTREFEQAEIEYFVKPDKEVSEKSYKEWIEEVKSFYTENGIKEKNLKEREHEKDELSHYSAGTCDIEYDFPFGMSELGGIAQRTDYDLKQHQSLSKQDMQYFNEESGEKYIPFVVEPSMGVDRAMLAFLVDAYDESDGSDGRAEGEVTLHLNPKIAPVKVGIFPLMKKEGLPEIAQKITTELRKSGINIFYDESGSIGRRYRRQDEIGTPWCVTVDFDSLKDNAVTIRDRDSLKQERLQIPEIVKYISEKLR